nr:unnamed protein product [Digitaria exilis]
MLRRRPRLSSAIPSPPAPAHRRAFRSEAALEAIHSHSLPSKAAATLSSSDADDQAGPASLALYNYPTFAGAYAALAARLFHQRVRRRLLVLPFSSVEPFRAEDFEGAGFQTCYLLDFIGPKKFAFELSKFVPRPIGAVVFMQRGILKVCLRTTDSTTNTAEIAKAYGGGGKPSSSSFALRMDEFNTWTSVNSRMVN